MNYQVGSFQYKWCPGIPNTFNFYGTNEKEDLPYSARCWPKNGIHEGIQDATAMITQEIISKAVLGAKIRLKGHSLGGSALFEVMVALEKMGRVVELYVEGPFPIYRKKSIPRIKGKVTIMIFGNDAVTKLFPWFRYPGNKKYIKNIGPDRKWWKFSMKDHVAY